MIEQALARRAQLNATPPALQESNAEGGLEALDPRAGGGQRQMGPLRAARDAARLGHRDEQLQVDQIETHGYSISLIVRRRSLQDEDGEPAFVLAEGLLRNLQIVPATPIGQCHEMVEPLLILIAAVFL